MRSLLLSLAVVAAASAGCMSNEAKDDSNPPPREEKEYVTGSNLPRRDRSNSGVDIVTREGLDKIQRTTGGLLTK